jgi:hypothetical protein
MHIRYYGYLANRNRHQKLQRIRSLLPEAASSQNHTSADSADNTTPRNSVDTPDEVDLCPQCKSGRLLFVEEIPSDPNCARSSWSYDSS